MATVRALILLLLAAAKGRCEEAAAAAAAAEPWDSTGWHSDWYPDNHDEQYYAQAAQDSEMYAKPADCAFVCAAGYGYELAVRRLADERHGCISVTRLCDGVYDCVDGADERRETCEEHGRDAVLGEYDLLSGADADEYVAALYADRDIGKAADCTHECAQGYVYPFDHYMGCIKTSNLCDGVVHCKGGTDESAEQCTGDMQCADGRFVCWSRRLVHGFGTVVRDSTPVCADNEHRCDGEKDCDDGADEQGC